MLTKDDLEQIGKVIDSRLHVEREQTKKLFQDEREHTKNIVQAEREHTKVIVQAEREQTKKIVQDEREYTKKLFQEEREHTKNIVQAAKEEILETISKETKTIANFFQTTWQKFDDHEERIQKLEEDQISTHKN